MSQSVREMSEPEKNLLATLLDEKKSTILDEHNPRFEEGLEGMTPTARERSLTWLLSGPLDISVGARYEAIYAHARILGTEHPRLAPLLAEGLRIEHEVFGPSRS